MKTLLSYRKTTIVFGLIGVLLGACSNEKAGIFDFECGKQSEGVLNIQYDRTKNKFRFISYEEKGKDEKILGIEFDTFEKDEEVLFKINNTWELANGDVFLNLKNGTIKMPYYDRQAKIKQQTIECKRI
jgi:hypothetical protein